MEVITYIKEYFNNLYDGRFRIESDFIVRWCNGKYGIEVQFPKVSPGRLGFIHLYKKKRQTISFNDPNGKDGVCRPEDGCIINPKDNDGGIDIPTNHS